MQFDREERGSGILYTDFQMFRPAVFDFLGFLGSSRTLPRLSLI